MLINLMSFERVFKMLTSIYKFIALLYVISFISIEANAFPWVVQHGYTTCMTCHYSPSGGGALTNYGKFVSGELMGRYNDSSTALPWLRNPTIEDKFEKKFFSQNIDWILGMQGRVVQTYFDTPVIRRGDPRLMQFDIETGFNLDSVFAIVQVGARGAQVAPGQKPGDLNVRQFYVGSRDIDYAFRVGRFFPEYGIRYPNHNIPTRKGLYFNHNEEPFLIQYSRYFQSVDVNLGYLEGATKTILADKKGVVGSVVYRTGHTRTGISHLSAKKGTAEDTSTSIYSAIGFLEAGYVLAEYGVAKAISSSGGKSEKEVGFFETGFEFTKGWVPYFGYQKNNAKTSKSNIEYIPVGVKIFPLTHIEFNAEAGKVFLNSSDFGTQALLMGHWFF
jgi:hypothetical protein